MGIANPRKYTVEQKRQALARAREVGPVQAAQEIGIPMGTLSSWQFTERHQPRARELAPGGPVPSGESGKTSPETPANEVAAASPVKPGTRARARVRKLYAPSQVAQALERAAAIGVRPASKELGISRTTLRDWERKAAKAARGEGPAPTSGPGTLALEARRDEAILAEWRKQQGLGPSQVRNQLRRAGMKVSMQTVRRVMVEAGYLPPKTKTRDHTGNYEAVRPNQLWHLDFVHRHVHKQPVFILVFLDDYSRFVTGHGLDDAERADVVLSSLEAAVARYGKPEAVMHDGGSAFWSWKGASRFTRLLEEYGIDQYKVDHPETNGKIEVFNGNLHKELLDRVVFQDVGDLRRRLSPHFHWYNHHRTHHALGGLLVPADRFYGRVEEVLARIEGGTGAPESLDLGSRMLDLFRVVSHRGKPEIWLMGQKVFEAKD